MRSRLAVSAVSVVSRQFPRAFARTPCDPGLFVSLAPMDGVTDWAHRELASSLGGVSQCVSEFVRVTDHAVPAKVFLRDVPELGRGGTTSHGVPVCVQILGGEPRAMAASAVVAARLGARGIDLNFGCPARRVNNHDGGASILRSPERAELITRAVRDAVPGEIPVSVKIRLGWADSESVVELAQRVERGGAAWLTIHGRTKQQMYMPPVDYAAIGRARRSVQIPVVANGDLASRADVARCTALSGIDSAFMLGRATLARPWLFRALRGQPVSGAPGELAQVLLRYAAIIEQAGYPPEHALRRLKQWLSLATAAAPEVRPLFEVVKVQRTLREAQHALFARGQLSGSTCPSPCP